MQVLIDKLAYGELKKKPIIPSIILQKIIQGVHDSPQVPQRIKKQLPLLD